MWESVDKRLSERWGKKSLRAGGLNGCYFPDEDVSPQRRAEFSKVSPAALKAGNPEKHKPHSTPEFLPR